MSQDSLFSVCGSCGREHSDGNFLVCDACSDGAEPGFRAYLKGQNPFYGLQDLHDAVVGAFAGWLLCLKEAA